MNHSFFTFHKDVLLEFQSCFLPWLQFALEVTSLWTIMSQTAWQMNFYRVNVQTGIITHDHNPASTRNWRLHLGLKRQQLKKNTKKTMDQLVSSAFSSPKSPLGPELQRPKRSKASYFQMLQTPSCHTWSLYLNPTVNDDRNACEHLWKK